MISCCGNVLINIYINEQDKYMIESIVKVKRIIQKHTLLRNTIFILSPPRSGSTLLFEIMTHFAESIHFGHESDFIWWECFPYETMPDPSDYIGKSYVNSINISLLREKTFESLIARNCVSRGCSRKLFLDKTISNCFHLEFIEQAFPTAQYIFLVRDPCANISSMIEGWPFINRFGKSQLTSVLNKQQERTIDHWTYPAPPGWQQQVMRPLAEICAWSWQQHVEYVLTYFQSTGRSCYMLKYEELISNPRLVVAEIARRFRLQLTDKILEYAKCPKLSATTVTPPQKDKWRALHYREIMGVIPMIENTANKLGYANFKEIK